MRNEQKDISPLVLKINVSLKIVVSLKITPLHNQTNPNIVQLYKYNILKEYIPIEIHVKC